MGRSIYIIGSLRNPKVPELANKLRSLGYDVFDDWYSPGPETDDYWQAYEKARGRSYKEALNGYHPKQVFEFDKYHIDRSDTIVLCLPAGKSAHLELGYAVGTGKTAYILLDGDPDRYDIMYLFASDIFNNEGELIETLSKG